MRAVQSTLRGYDADAGVPYPHLCILFFFTAGDDGMTRNGLQEKEAYPTIGELMESKNKIARSAWQRQMCNGKAVCSVSTIATRAVPWPPPAPSQIPRIPREPVNHAQTRKTPRHPAERSVIAGPQPCFCQTRQTRRHKPKDRWRGASPGLLGNSRRV